MSGKNYFTPDREYLFELFSFNKKTGALKWKKRPSSHFTSDAVWKKWNSRYAGKIAGATSHCRLPYIVIRFGKKSYYAHRLIYKMFVSEIPRGLFIDHKNGNPRDNRISNLRIATAKQNLTNRRGPNKTSKSGLRGVHYVASRNRWAAKMTLNGRGKYLGYFMSKEDAYEVVKSASIKANGEYAGAFKP